MATSSNEWFQIYDNNLIGPPKPSVLQWFDDVVTEATTVTTTTTTSASSVSNQLGRVTRPTNMRRRSRVSRKTPTTLLNTDTTNFRAMVQQFTGVGGDTGGGSTPFMTAPTTVAPRQPLSSWNTNSAGLDYYGTGSKISPISDGGYNGEFQQPQDQQYYTMVADNGGGDGADHQHGFVQMIQEGGTFSSDNNNSGKNTPNMF